MAVPPICFLISGHSAVVVQEHTTNWKKVCMTSAESYCYMRIYQRKLPISYQEAQTLLRQPYMSIQKF